MLLRLLPHDIRKFFEMPKQQRKYELKLTMLFMPSIYIGIALVAATLTLWLDLELNITKYTPSLLDSSPQTTRLLVSTLIGGILTLSAFTLNSVLVALTTFSGQFSPRMLLDYVADRRTQHVLGIFHGAFVYVLVVFLFISNQPNQYYAAVSFTTVLIAFIAVIVFIYFINHTATWLQVHNITNAMNTSSIKTLKGSVSESIERFRIDPTKKVHTLKKGEQYARLARKTGYIQLIDIPSIIEEAQKDKLTLQMHVRIGNYILRNNPLFTIWGPGAKEADIEKYCKFVTIGHKQTEIQDIEQGINKLTEIAVKALGNHDPRTTTNTLYQLTDLLTTISQNVTFSPYLVDKQNIIRMSFPYEEFEYYLYKGFATIRHHAEGNYLVITVMIDCILMMTKSIDTKFHQTLWEFACNTVDGIEHHFVYTMDRDYLFKALESLAIETNNLAEFEQIKKRIYN